MKNLVFVIWLLGASAIYLWERNTWDQRHARPDPAYTLIDIIINTGVIAYVAWLLYEH